MRLYLGWNDFYANGWTALRDNGVPTSQHDTLYENPSYLDISGGVAAAWDLHPAPGSPLTDAGDGLDIDGSTADIGAYGGATPLE
jgi:hypothetical protein